MKNTKMLAVMLCGSLLLSGCNTHNISETPDTKNSYTTPMPVFSTTDESSKSTTVIETTLPLSADTSADTTTTTSPPQSEAPAEETSVSSETTDFVTVHWPLDEDEDTILNNNIYTSATESTSANEVFCPPATYVTTTARTTAATTNTIQTKKPEGNDIKRNYETNRENFTDRAVTTNITQLLNNSGRPSSNAYKYGIYNAYGVRIGTKWWLYNSDLRSWMSSKIDGLDYPPDYDVSLPPATSSPGYGSELDSYRSSLVTKMRDDTGKFQQDARKDYNESNEDKYRQIRDESRRKQIL